jgi:hypothetical protein
VKEPAAEKRAAMQAATSIGAAAARVIAMRPTDAQAQGALFAEPFMLPNEREATESGMVDGEAETSRWPRASYVIAAAIAVVLVTVFTLYGLMRS